jgi:outer membrane biogenesis lipoprotein LolB
MRYNKLGHLLLSKKSLYLVFALVCLSGCYSEKPRNKAVAPHTKKSYEQYQSDLKKWQRRQTENTVKYDSSYIIMDSLGRQK